jgi:hypothetical protein
MFTQEDQRRAERVQDTIDELHGLTDQLNGLAEEIKSIARDTSDDWEIVDSADTVSVTPEKTDIKETKQLDSSVPCEDLENRLESLKSIVIKIKGHRFKPFKTFNMRNTPEGQRHRQALRDADSKKFKDARNARYVNRRRVNITYDVQVRDEEDMRNLGWRVRVNLTAPAPAGEVDDVDQSVTMGEDYWNDVKDGKCWIHIKGLHTGEVEGGRPVVRGERLKLSRNARRQKLTQDQMRMCEAKSLIRWANLPVVKGPDLKQTVVERAVRLYIVGCVKIAEHYLCENVRNDEKNSMDFFNGLHDSKADEMLPVKRMNLHSVLPTVNSHLGFNPLTREIRHTDSGWSTDVFSSLLCIPSVKSVESEKSDWFFRGLRLSSELSSE